MIKRQLTTLDVGNLTKLEYLYCNDNKLTSLDLSKNKQLSKLNCFGNTISSLDLSQNSQLEIVRCYKNVLTKLNINGCNQLTLLHCGENRLTSLDVSANTKLERLYCDNNDISKLDVSNNEQLNTLFCYNNKLSVEAFDDLFCSLPNRKDKEAGKIAPTLNKSSAEKDKILSTNGINAITRNWMYSIMKRNTILAVSKAHISAEAVQASTKRKACLHSPFTRTLSKMS